MGRTFDAIQLAEARLLGHDSEPDPLPTPVPVPTRVTRPRVTDALDVLPELPADAPFIEVGPRLLLGSPDVLAVAVERPTPKPEPAPTRVQLRPTPPPLAGAVTGTFPPEIVAFHEPNHELAGQYRALLDAILGLRSHLGPRIHGFTTALTGTSLAPVLLNLGVAAARGAERRVVVIEADLRQPTLAGRMGLSASPGLVEVLTGVVPLERAVRITPQPNLLVLPVGEVTPEAFDRFRIDPLRATLQRLALKADLLLIALPRWDGRPDVVALTGACDSLFLVAPEAEAEQGHVRDAQEQLPALGAPLAGTILLAA